MKKIIICLMTTCLSLLFLPIQSNAGAVATLHTPAVAVSIPSESPEAKALVSRLEEINSMDKSTLSGAEKRALRQEVRSIDKNLRNNYNGVYISVGGLIIILLLLIILL